MKTIRKMGSFVIKKNVGHILIWYEYGLLVWFDLHHVCLELHAYIQ